MENGLQSGSLKPAKHNFTLEILFITLDLGLQKKFKFKAYRQPHTC